MGGLGENVRIGRSEGGPAREHCQLLFLNVLLSLKTRGRRALQPGCNNTGRIRTISRMLAAVCEVRVLLELKMDLELGGGCWRAGVEEEVGVQDCKSRNVGTCAKEAVHKHRTLAPADRQQLPTRAAALEN
jgi:hypothetical protein